MRTPIPLDLRNIKDVHVRAQLRKLADIVADMGPVFTSPDLYPAQPGSITSITNNTIVDNPTEVPVVSVFDDCQRDIVGGTVSIAAGIGEINWGTFVSTVAATNVTKDTTTYPQSSNPGVWKISPGGNVGEFVYISPTAALTASQYSVCRSRGKLHAKIGAGISATTQRQHFRAGIGYFPGGAAFPAFYIGFVWWYVDETYASQVSYASLNLQNDPIDPALQKDMFMIEVVDNNVATAKFIDPASGHTSIDALEIIIENGNVIFKVNDIEVGQLADLAIASPHGQPVVGMRSRGTNNPGGNRNGFLDYFGLTLTID